MYNKMYYNNNYWSEGGAGTFLAASASASASSGAFHIVPVPLTHSDRDSDFHYLQLRKLSSDIRNLRVI